MPVRGAEESGQNPRIYCVVPPHAHRPPSPRGTAHVLYSLHYCDTALPSRTDWPAVHRARVRACLLLTLFTQRGSRHPPAALRAVVRLRTSRHSAAVIQQTRCVIARYHLQSKLSIPSSSTRYITRSSRLEHQISCARGESHSAAAENILS